MLISASHGQTISGTLNVLLIILLFMPLRDKRVERENKLLLKELPYYGCKDLASAHQQFNIICSHPLCPEINLTNLRAYLTLTSLI